MSESIVGRLQARTELGKKDFRKCYGEFGEDSEKCLNCGFNTICARQTELMAHFEEVSE